MAEDPRPDGWTPTDDDAFASWREDLESLVRCGYAHLIEQAFTRIATADGQVDDETAALNDRATELQFLALQVGIPVTFEDDECAGIFERSGLAERCDRALGSTFKYRRLLDEAQATTDPIELDAIRTAALDEAIALPLRNPGHEGGLQVVHYVEHRAARLGVTLPSQLLPSIDVDELRGMMQGWGWVFNARGEVECTPNGCNISVA